MIPTRKRLLVDIFSLAAYQNHLHFASLRVLILSPVFILYGLYILVHILCQNPELNQSTLKT